MWGWDSLKRHSLGERGSDSEEAGVCKRSVTLISGSAMVGEYTPSICVLRKYSALVSPLVIEKVYKSSFINGP